MEVPDGLLYTKDHFWVIIEGERVRCGITDFAQSELGDVVFVELPEVGKRVERGERIGDVESIKTVSNLYAPISGIVVEVNGALDKKPELINQHPFGDGWICIIQPDAQEELETLLDDRQYQELIQAEQS